LLGISPSVRNGRAERQLAAPRRQCQGPYDGIRSNARRLIRQAQLGPRAEPELLDERDYATPAAFNAARTRAGVSGAVRIRTPVASKNAFATAAAGETATGSPTPAVSGLLLH